MCWQLSDLRITPQHDKAAGFLRSKLFDALDPGLFFAVAFAHSSIASRIVPSRSPRRSHCWPLPVINAAGGAGGLARARGRRPGRAWSGRAWREGGGVRRQGEGHPSTARASRPRPSPERDRLYRWPTKDGTTASGYGHLTRSRPQDSASNSAAPQ